MTPFTTLKAFLLGKRILAIRFVTLSRTTLITFLLHELLKFLNHQGNIIISASLTIIIMIIIIWGFGLECNNLLLVIMEITMKFFLRLLNDIMSENFTQDFWRGNSLQVWSHGQCDNCLIHRRQSSKKFMRCIHFGNIKPEILELIHYIVPSREVVHQFFIW
jgi:hypothetical protein